MDASNPVQDSTRVSIGSIRNRSARIARQNLAALDKALRGKERNLFEALAPLELEEGWVHQVRQHANAFAREWSEKMDPAQDKTWERLLDEVVDVVGQVPVSGLLLDGVPLHTPGVSESKGFVSTVKTFGGVGIDRGAVLDLVEYLGIDEAYGALEQVSIYTQGTRKGFYQRCREQLARPCVQVSTSVSKAQFMKLMEKRMPVDIEKLPNWGDELQSQVDLLVTSFKSSAGAPYWRSKLDAVDAMQNVVLPMIVKAIQEDSLDQLYREQPELWLCELKNKVDRYEDPVKKTRPYVAQPWHWQALFSCLSQPFCQALKLFEHDKRSRNAYGFSYAHGGGLKLRKHVMSSLKKDGDMTYVVYGDDVDFYYLSNGVVHRVCPDFKQMDGSVDATCINWTIDYIIACFEKKFGGTYANFWKSVAEEWKTFATQPLLLVDGTKVVRKKSPDGLMTGVVGTTLFDTVKSVVAYELFLASAKGRPSMLQAKQATEFFASLGLVIKDGTWVSEVVAHKPEVGSLWTTQKFLGMQMAWVDAPAGPLLVPVLPDVEWQKLYLTPRSDMVDKRASRIAQHRYTFDRMRGLLTTGAVFNPKIRKLFASILRNLDPVAIVMMVQAGEGTGALPEFGNVVGSDFRYETSMGWPTLEWAVDLYSPPSEKVGLSMTPVFTCGEEPFRVAHSRPELKLEVAAIDVTSYDGVDTSVVVTGEALTELPNPVGASLMPDKVAERTAQDFNPRSKIKDVNDEAAQPKKLPTLAEVILHYMRPQKLMSARAMLDLMRDVWVNGNKPKHPVWKNLLRPDMMYQFVVWVIQHAPRVMFEEWWGEITKHMIYSVGDLASKIGVSEDRLEQEARKLGYYVVGKPGNRWVTGVELAGVSKKILLQFREQAQENKAKLKQVREEVKKATVEKVPEMKRQEKSIASVVKRAVEKPAVVVSEPKVQGLPRMNLVPNLDTSNRDPTMLRETVAKIMSHNEMKATRKETRDENGWAHTFYVNDVPVLVLYRHGGKEGWLYFYNMVLNAYVEDTTRVQKGENWADYVDREKSEHIKVYRTSAGPVFMQRKNGALELLRKVEGVRLAADGTTVMIEVGNAWQELTLRSGTMNQRAKRLAQVLGEAVTAESAPLNELASKYDIVAKRVKNNARKQSQNRSKSGHYKNSYRKAEAQGSAKAQPQRSTVTHEPSRSSTSGERGRFLRPVHDGHQGQSWRSQSTNNRKPLSLDRNPYSKRGIVVAKMETNKSPN